MANGAPLCKCGRSRNVEFVELPTPADPTAGIFLCDRCRGARSERCQARVVPASSDWPAERVGEPVESNGAKLRRQRLARDRKNRTPADSA